jgi:hypothetical protein
MVVELTQLKAYILNDNRTKIMVTKPGEDVGAGAQKDVRDFARLFEQMNSRPPNDAPPGGPKPGGQGGFNPVGGGVRQMMGRGIPPVSSDKEVNFGFVELDKLDDQKNVKLAEDILPLRMAIVVAAFPYKKQLVEFQEALHFPTLAALLADKESSPRFEGLLVERQEIGPDGKEKGWAKLDLERTLKPFFFVTHQRFESDDPQLQKVIFDGLATPRPVQFRSGAYQELEARLKHIESTLAELKKNGRGVPEYCLVRFLDVTIEPGKTYEYRFKIKMHNPNYKRTDVAFPELAESKDITSKWVGVPERLAVDSALNYYAVDQKELDRKALPPKEFAGTWDNALPPRLNQVMFQAQRWVDFAYPDPWNRRTGYAVGDWVIAERYPVYRGEYVGQVVKTEVPVWSFVEEKFVLAPAGRGRERAIPVVFGDDTQEDNPLLVDFEGGELRHVRIEPSDAGREDELKRTKEVTDRAPVEVLLLTPDGKLRVRDSDTDAQDWGRLERHKAWKDHVGELRPKAERSGKPGDRPNPFDK